VRAEALRLLAAGKSDALMAFPPLGQARRAKGRGHVVVNSGRDRSWSQSCGCVGAGHKACVRTYPVATKRAVRASLKGVDLGAREPEWAARFLVDGGVLRSSC
jgi:NitT/TauT family transport system substrate-binding protein